MTFLSLCKLHAATEAAHGRRTRDKKGKKNCRIVIGLYKGTHVCTNPLLIRTRMCNVVLRYVHTAQYQFCRVSVPKNESQINC